MRIAIVHYHLRRGGVTRVIENAVAALGGRARCVVLAGEVYRGDALPQTAVVEGLGYRAHGKEAEAAALADSVRAAARKALGGEPDLWHVHNHALGKNVCFPAALRRILADAARVLLQIHDFAEDGRPRNYAAQRAFYEEQANERFARDLYPAAPQIHYATLNARDDGILDLAGVPGDCRHRLPNAVSVPELKVDTRDPLPGGEALYLYPTRAIRRKNIGELALLAAVSKKCGHEALYATTLAPDNPEWQAIHNDWVDFARSATLPVRFALGETPGASFPALIRRARAPLSTSVAEGFGLAFLEPWLFGKAVCGRDLPEITADFAESGVRLEGLYKRLPVRLDPREHAVLARTLAKSLADACAAYGREPAPDAVDRALAAISNDEGCDFGALSEELQRSVIRRVLREGPSEALRARLPADPGDDLVRSNREAVEEAYSLDTYGERLAGLYQTILGSPTTEPSAHNAAAILDAFLRPERFSLLRQ